MSLTDGHRIYAMGDIHGCRDEMSRHHDLIANDLASEPHPAPRLIHIGDYVDRGPDSKGVVEDLQRRRVPVQDSIHLLGNHDEMFLRYLDMVAVPGARLPWRAEIIGGNETLLSYGVPLGDEPSTVEIARRKVSPVHRRFLNGLPRAHRVGGYMFVHAGIRPGVALDAQDPVDLVWIRGDFLDSKANHGAIIVHGHTPVQAPEHRGNRIAIDTGFVYGRTLTTLVLEDDQAWTLDETGRKPLKSGRSFLQRLVN